MKFVQYIKLPFGFAHIIYDPESDSWGYMIHDHTKPDDDESAVDADFGFPSLTEAIRALVNKHGIRPQLPT